jgi:hypothetical protein
MRVNFNAPVLPVTEKKVVHNITILDSSGSMGGSKWLSAVQFVNKEMVEYQNQDLVDVVFSTVIFSNSSNIIQWRTNTPKQVDYRYDFIGSGTALNDAIVQTLNKVLADNQEEQVLVKIFTDGQENGSRFANERDVKKVINTCMEKGYTITFSGTAYDVRVAQNLYGIDASNTFVHENTAKSIDKYAAETVQTTTAYFKAVAKGEDVTRGFYTKTTTTNND